MCNISFMGKCIWIDAGKLVMSQYEANPGAKQGRNGGSRSLGGAWDIPRCHAHSSHRLPYRLLSVTLGFVFIAFSYFIYIFILWILETEWDSWYQLQIAAADGLNTSRNIKYKQQETLPALMHLPKEVWSTDESRGQVISKLLRFDFSSCVFLFFTLPTQSHP